jgi:hypothetical protein
MVHTSALEYRCLEVMEISELEPRSPGNSKVFLLTTNSESDSHSGRSILGIESLPYYLLITKFNGNKSSRLDKTSLTPFAVIQADSGLTIATTSTSMLTTSTPKSHSASEPPWTRTPRTSLGVSETFRSSLSPFLISTLQSNLIVPSTPHLLIKPLLPLMDGLLPINWIRMYLYSPHVTISDW